MEKYVTEELCLQIFLNLPVKSLLRFKCVCKLWNKIFSSKSFSDSYLANKNKKSSSNTKKYLIFEHEDFYSAHIIDGTESCYDIQTTNHVGCYRPNLSETGLEQYESCYLKVYGICNGLLCLSDGGLRLKSSIYLWNPIARRGKKIPDSHMNKTSLGAAHSLAFGYHDDDYKVIKIARYGDIYRVCIYSLSTNAWEFLTFNLLDNIHDDVYYDKYMQYPNAMLVNGVAYFLKQEPCRQVVCFDISYERIQAVDFPEHSEADSSFFMKANGKSIALVEYCKTADLVMWILSRSCSGKFTWGKIFSVPLENKYPLGFIDDNKLMVRTYYTNEFMLFNIETTQFTDLKFQHQFGTSEPWGTALGVDYFVESLVLLDHEKTMNHEYIVKKCCSAISRKKKRKECCSTKDTAFKLLKWKT